MLAIKDGRDQMSPVHIPRPKPGGADPGRPEEDVRKIVDQVRMQGDEALISQTERLDHVRLTKDRLRVDPETIAKSRSLVRPELIDALEVMGERLRATSEKQMPHDWMDRRQDEFVGELIRPLRRVGIY